MLTVRPAAFFSQPPLLADQEPVSELAQRHVMVPPMPRSHLEVVQADLALGFLEYLLDAVPLAGVLYQPAQGCGGPRPGEAVGDSSVPRLLDDHERLGNRFGTVPLSHHRQCQGNNVERPLLVVAYAQPLPLADRPRLRHRIHPPDLLVTDEPNARVTRNVEYIALPERPDAVAYFTRAAELVVTQHPLERELCSQRARHLQRHLGLAPVLDILRNVDLGASLAVLRPRGRQVDLRIGDAGEAAQANVDRVHAHNAAIHLAVPATPLARHPHCRVALLRRRRAVEHERRVRAPDLARHLAPQLLPQRVIIPLARPDELLEVSPLDPMHQRDGLHRLALQHARQALDHLDQTCALLRPHQQLPVRIAVSPDTPHRFPEIRFAHRAGQGLTLASQLPRHCHASPSLRGGFPYPDLWSSFRPSERTSHSRDTEARVGGYCSGAHRTVGGCRLALTRNGKVRILRRPVGKRHRA